MKLNRGVIKVLLVAALAAGAGFIFMTSRHKSEPVKPVASAITQISSGKVPSTPLAISQGYTIHVFAQGLGQARDLEFSPDGTLLVSDIQNGRVLALPDKDQDGVSDKATVVAQGVLPHGLAFYAGKLYVAELQRVVRYNWDGASLKAGMDKELFSLPANEDHNRRSIIFDRQGNLYVSVGSSCNVCIEEDSKLATVLQSDKDGNNLHVYASGLRNAPFMVANPVSGALWATEMGRDNLGDNLPPDEVNIIKKGLNYGWPNCYGNKIHDTNFDRSSANPCTNTESPIYEIPAHSAPLGLAFIEGKQFSDQNGNLLVAYHGSWNRSVPDGYKVVLLKLKGNSIVGSSDFITGFNNATARPVDMIFDKRGNLYLSDDKGGVVYIIQKQNLK